MPTPFPVNPEFLRGLVLCARKPAETVPDYSRSMVLGSLEEMSSATRLMPRVSLMMRLEMRASTS